MLLELFGFLLSSIIGAVTIIYKITGDIVPAGFTRFLHRNALKNWQKSQPKRLGFYNTGNPKTTAETGIFPSAEEDALEVPRKLQHSNEVDEITFYGVDDNGNGLLVRMTRFYGDITEAQLHLYLNGVSYSVSRRGRNSSLTEFVLGNFKLEMVEAMRCWRIWYNGILRVENNGQSVHAVLNFLWKPMDTPLDTKRDLNRHLLSDYFTKSGSFGTTLFNLSKVLPDGYIQFGAHHGTIRIDDGNEERLYLYGFRNRKWDSLPLQPTINDGKFPNSKIQVELFGMSGCDGNAFRLAGTTDGWIDGHTLFPSNKKFQINHVDVEPRMFVRDAGIPKLFTVTDQNRSFHIEIWPRFIGKKFLDMEIVLLKLTVNGKSGRGILLRTFDHSFPDSRFNSIIDTSIISSHEIMEKVSSPLSQGYESPRALKATPEIVTFQSEHGRDVAIVGGKGASLAHLHRISEESGDFLTAKGFCVTTACFRQHLPLDEFRTMFANTRSKDLESTCTKVMERIKSSNAEAVIRPLLPTWINEVFGGSGEVKLAVRSSGTLEDGTELSCAGQNQTFLGIFPQDVPKKVVECWASLFTLQSVQYRLNHGQPAVSEMAVVIQEMVHARAAGVLFTANPRTGNPYNIMISANYGLGESVVSAACDPDTIILSRSEAGPELRVTETLLGTKKSKIVLNQEGSTAEVDIDNEDSGSYCISNYTAIALGKAAVKIEKELGDLKPVDIEWAVDEKGEIYILQCRSITSLDSWTNFELIHEADSPYNTKSERLTHANTGEVMPGVTSPLSLSIVLKLLDVGIQLRANNRSGDPNPIVPYALRKCACSRQRLLLNVLNVLYVSLDKEITPDKVTSDISIFGHRVMDEELHALAVERHGLTSPLQKICELFSLIMTIWETKTEIIRATKRFGNYKIPLDTLPQDAKAVYKVLTERIFDFYEVSNTHCMTSEASTVTQMFALLSLAQGRKADEWDSDIYEDVSKVLSVCMDVESADLPTAMNELAKTVADHGGRTDDILRDFVEKNPSDGYHWLSHHEEPIIRESLDNFFEKHGHRCISELDLMRKSWKSDPIPFVNLLQSLVKNKIKFDGSKTNGPRVNQYKNDEALLSSLHTPLGFVGKCFMKFLLPYCRRAVWNREKTKSYMVRTGDQLKQGYELLAHLMVKDHLLPDPQLIYFMTHQQINQLLNRHHSSPKILYKAMRKMKLFPELNKEEYPEITIGIREPVEQMENVEYGDSITATPVSSGKVQAKGKVCMTIEEASRLIEPGDILITHGTDIGWSPFFPILGGIVTELGGLISHGAVVAREYGLPCIVGAGNATKMFKTGELLLLDAGKGTLTKVKVNS